MKRSTVLWVLAVLNAALLVTLTWKLGGENPAQAQGRAGRGDFVLAPGRAQNATNGIIYVLDTRNGVLGAFVYDSNRRVLNILQPIPLGRFFENAGPVGPGVKPQ